MTQIIENGHVVRGWLGVEAQDITPELAESFKLSSNQGVLIAGVVRNGPAYMAGIEPGDIIVRMNQRSVSDAKTALAMISRFAPGERLRVTVVRDGKELQLRAKVQQRPVPN